MDIPWKKLRTSYTVLIVLLIGFAIGATLVKLATPELTADYSIKVINDRDYFPTVHNLLTSAKTSIHISMFSLTYYLEYPDSNVNVLLEAIADAHDSGVDVKVIVDEYPEDIEEGVSYLQARGVPVRYDGDEQSVHTKLIIVDSKAVVVGSTNWRYYSMDKNYEANVLIFSLDTAEEYEEYFNAIWEKSHEPSA